MRASQSLDRRTFLKSVGLVASASCLSAGCATTSNTVRGGRDTHRILCANIRVPLEADDQAGFGWNDRKEVCADVIRSQEADIVCLQECFGNQLADLKARLPNYDSYGLSHVAPEYRTGNAILYSPKRYEVISAGGFWLSKTPHIAGSRSWDSAGSRFANWLDLRDRKSGGAFRVWSTHLDHKGQTAREEQARLVCEGAETPHPEDFPQILAGDMNADMRNLAISTIKARGWKDTYAAVHGETDPGFTYHRFIGPKYGEVRKGDLGKIDWIFVRGRVQTLAAEVVRDHRDGRFPSDHYFISAEVMI